MKLLNRFKDSFKAKESCQSTQYVLNIVPTNVVSIINSKQDDFIQIIGYKFGQPDRHLKSNTEKLNISRLYYTDKIKSILIDGLVKTQPVRFKCVKFKASIKNKIDNLIGTWKVLSLQANDQWIEIENQSKLF